MTFRICARFGDPLYDHTPCPLDLGEISSCYGCSFLVAYAPGEPIPYEEDEDLDNETSGS